MKYYVDQSGNYIGGFTDGSPAIPAGAAEVPTAPEHASQTWDVSNWSAPPQSDEPLTAEELYDILEAKNVVRSADRPRARRI